ncbi:MAG: 2-phosphosulfolactate phosphatase [Gemmatimonadales bacterium]|nr:2-phosphosulfolactate phosphatase [Gemmatimonadales bacterium]
MSMKLERTEAASGGPRTVVIDAYPSAALEYTDDYAIVAIDVIRATTTAMTAVACGRRCFVAPTVDAASVLAQELDHPLLAGEIGGNMPFGFEMDNSPAEIAERTDVERAMILVTSSGTLLIHNAALSGHAYLACFRNVGPTVRHLATRYERVAVIGAGSRGEFREEDQFCCAQVASGLLSSGFSAANDRTLEIVERWRNEAPDAWLRSNSVRFLRSTGQERDLEFILAHRNDLDDAYRIEGSEVRRVGGADDIREKRRERVAGTR